MEQTKISYLAGILDGEGHFSITLHQSRYTLSIGVMNTSKDLMAWLQENFGGKVYFRKNPSNKPNWKERYEWRLDQKDADSVLKMIEPYMVIKRRQVAVAAEFRSTFNLSFGNVGLAEHLVVLRQSLRSQMLLLNK